MPCGRSSTSRSGTSTARCRARCSLRRRRQRQSRMSPTGRGMSTACAWASGASKPRSTSKTSRATMAVNASVCLSLSASCAGCARRAAGSSWGTATNRRRCHLEQDQRAMIRKSIDDHSRIHRQAAARLARARPRGNLGHAGVARRGRHRVPLRLGGRRATLHDQDRLAHRSVVVPYTVELNDIPMMMIQHHAAAELFNRARDQFDRLYEEGEQSARIMAIAVHPYISGVPHRIKYFEAIYDYMKQKPGCAVLEGRRHSGWYRTQRAG